MCVRERQKDLGEISEAELTDMIIRKVKDLQLKAYGNCERKDLYLDAWR